MTQYRITTTINNRESAVNYDSREIAVKRWDEIREIYAYFGYTIADACGDDIDNGGLAELWIKEGYSSRNIEIWPVQE